MKTRAIALGILFSGIALTTVAQTQQPQEQKKRLTVQCYWQNYAAVIFSKLMPSVPDNGCGKYKDPSHCQRTALEMLADTKHDWERVTANGLIYTIRCQHKCRRIPAPSSDTLDAVTDGKLMWITFERPDNRNWVETFEIFDISPMKEETANRAEQQKPPVDEPTIKAGTGFFVSDHGHILTNAHVVSGCKQIQIGDSRLAHLVSEDSAIDLALLKVEGEPPAVATFRLHPEPRLGDAVIAFGFPLRGMLSSEGNLSTGAVAARTGLGDDPRFIQVSAPIQPGNSGSPLLDSGGDVIGVVEAKLDAAQTFRLVGDIPQNVNFAIRASEAVRFLEKNGTPVRLETMGSVPDLKVADIASKAKQISVAIECVE